jgi:hypothetical protein
VFVSAALRVAFCGRRGGATILAVLGFLAWGVTDAVAQPTRYLSQASAKTRWSVAKDHETILLSVNGGAPTPFVIKGVDYSPRPINDAASTLPASDYFWGDPAHLLYGPIWLRDVWGSSYNRTGLTRPDGLVRQMGANSIRTYAWWKWVPMGPSDYSKWRTLDWTVGPHVRFGDKAAPRGFAAYPAHDGGDQFLDLCWNGGVKPIYVMIGIAVDPWLALPFTNRNPGRSRDVRAFMARTVKWLAQRYGYHPAVLGFAIGNETNVPTGYGTDSYLEYWRYLNSLGQIVKRYAPNKLTLSAFADYPVKKYSLLVTPLVEFKDQRRIQPGAETVPVCVEADGTQLSADCSSPRRRRAYPPDVYSLDVWGFNTYFKPESKELAEFKRYIVEGRYTNGGAIGTNTPNPVPRPLIWTEWGAPASSRVRPGRPPAAPNGEWVRADPGQAGRFDGAPGIHAAAMIQQIASDLYAPDSTLSTAGHGILSGGYVFEFSDEWWKQAPHNPATWSSHDTTNAQKTFAWGEPPNGYQSYWDEEWFGLLSAAPSSARVPQCEPNGYSKNGTCSGVVVGSGPGQPDDPVLTSPDRSLNGGPDVLSKRAGFYAIQSVFQGSGAVTGLGHSSH